MDTISEIQSNLPLTETTLYILLSLAPGPRHGYAIMKDVRSLSRKRVELSTGTLYSALKRLLDQGWIQRADISSKGTSESDLSASRNGRQRKDYVLTDLGRQILQAEVQRLQGLLQVARSRALGEAI
jgi:DNA-binding PadR family transcriptional regulator